MSASVKVFEDPPEARIAILAKHNRTPETIKVDIEIIRKWLGTQPHLPAIDLGDKRIEKFLILNKMSIERTKERLDCYFTARKLMPELFLDPLHPGVQIAMKQFFAMPLPKLTKDLDRVIVYRTLETDVEKINMNCSLAHMINICDYTLENEVNLSAIVILDCSNYSYKFLKFATPSLCKKLIYLFENVYTGRIKAIHFINVPSFIDTIMGLMKSLAPPKIFGRVHIHPTFESLLEHIPQEILPKDFGGKEKSLDELSDLWKVALEEYAPWAKLMNSCEVVEKLRPNKLENDETLGMHGNFRQLSVD